MLLQKIEEDIPLESFAITVDGSCALGHSHGLLANDNESVSSYSTNSTVSNLAGPGRVLGNLYGYAGKALERALGNIVHKAGFVPDAETNENTSLDSDALSTTGTYDGISSCQLGHRTIYGVLANDASIIFSHSTNSTVSNLVGPGRLIGNLYGFTGKRLEKRLGHFAQKVGYGPEVTYQKIRTLYLEDWRTDDQKGGSTL